MTEPAVGRALRLLWIIDLLREAPRRARELAEITGVDRRTISRDLDLLRSSPLPYRVEMLEHWEWHLIRDGK